MSELANVPIQLRVGAGKVDAIWLDGDASWVCDYYPLPDPKVETERLEYRRRALLRVFNPDLIEPSIELVPKLSVELDDEAGEKTAHLLRVTTLVMPYVNIDEYPQVPGLRMPPPTKEQIEQFMIENELRLGGKAIHASFGSAMKPPKVS